MPTAPFVSGLIKRAQAVPYTAVDIEKLSTSLPPVRTLAAAMDLALERGETDAFVVLAMGCIAAHRRLPSRFVAPVGLLSRDPAATIAAAVYATGPVAGPLHTVGTAARKRGAWEFSTILLPLAVEMEKWERGRVSEETIQAVASCLPQAHPDDARAPYLVQAVAFTADQTLLAQAAELGFRDRARAHALYTHLRRSLNADPLHFLPGREALPGGDAAAPQADTEATWTEHGLLSMDIDELAALDFSRLPPEVHATVGLRLVTERRREPLKRLMQAAPEAGLEEMVGTFAMTLTAAGDIEAARDVVDWFERAGFTVPTQDLPLFLSLERLGDAGLAMVHLCDHFARYFREEEETRRMLPYLAHSLLEGPFPELGLLVARGVAPLMGDEEGVETLAQKVEAVRTRLSLPPGDDIHKIIGLVHGRVRLPGGPGEDETP